MGQHSKSLTRPSQAEQAIRDQEVLRARRDLAAYFKGRRTEGEARAALKIIKAFVRDRERLEPERRWPLPGVSSQPAIVRRRLTFDAIARAAEISGGKDAEIDGWKNRIPWLANAQSPKTPE